MKGITVAGLSVLTGVVLMACGATNLGGENEDLKIAPEFADASALGVGRLVPNVQLVTKGKQSKLSDLAGTRGTVICMISATCPVSKKYTQTYRRLETELRAKGLNLVFVNPMASESAAEMKAQAGSLTAPYALDPKGEVAQALGATTTTEIFLLDSRRTLVYRGAIDDQYGIGYTRNHPENRYLLEAADAMLAGKDPAIRATTAPGCALNLKAEIKPMVETYHNRISRIIDNSCVKCHRPGGVGPFRLDSYAQVRDRAKMIQFVLDSKRMPPWFAVPAEGEAPNKWANDPTLSEADKKSIAAWVKAGMPEGDPKDAPIAKVWPTEWSIGKPDQIVSIPRPIQVQAEGFMDYVNVVVDPGLTEDKWVKAIQIMPSAKQVVHHVLVFLIPKGSNRSEDNEGLTGFFAGYVPGNDQQIFPAGFAKRLPAGTRMRFQIHYTPNGTATEDRMKLGMVFSPEAPEREIHTGAVASLLLNIPPGAANYKASGILPIPEDVEIFSFLPHMHVRGKAFRYEVRSANGNRETLLDIPRYDFNWQLEYKLRQPKSLKAGDRIIGTAWYDNSTSNPANPDPTARVRWGDQTTDEMMLGYMMYALKDPKSTTKLGGFGGFGR